MSRLRSRIFAGYLLITHCSLFIAFYFCNPNHSFGTFREVAEWSNATDSKSVIPARVSGVRIPPSLLWFRNPAVNQVFTAGFLLARQLLILPAGVLRLHSTAC